MKTTTLLILVSFFLLPNIYCQQTDSPKKINSSGNVYALMFLDYYYLMQGDDTYAGRSQYSENEKDDNAFSFRRIYLGYNHTFSEKFSGKVQMELTDFSTIENGARGFFLKEANIVWKDIYPLADLIIGQSGTPVFSIEGSESYWKYRSIEATIADIRGLRSSSDAGLRLKGLFNAKGSFGYNFMVGNGNSTRRENDKYKLVYMNLWTKLLEERLYLEIFQDYNNASNDRSIALTKGFIAWSTPVYTIGTELLSQLRSGYGDLGDDIRINGLSIFAHTDLIADKLRCFGRFDSFNPDVNFLPAAYVESVAPFDEQFYSFGLDYTPQKNIHVMPNIYINSYKNKSSVQTTPQTEIAARLTFHVNFR